MRREVDYQLTVQMDGQVVSNTNGTLAGSDGALSDPITFDWGSSGSSASPSPSSRG